ncbi:Cyclin, N-terminal domain [Ceratobasidium sp. AG-Ba]|nr:Cyclin, N-terminal domain [Ceratobasidium sp. AG-Ba]QRW09109.1 Cyclin, N-terminal domain [Ceratobasidium sp. AG-Ba]
MSGANKPRRTARSTRVVNQNAEQTTRRNAASVSVKDKPVAGTATTKPAKSTKASSNTTSAPAAPTNALNRKRKALGDNTNAEKKKKKVVDKSGKEKPVVRSKEHAADTPGTTASTSMRMVVELPTRKRPKTTKPQVKVDVLETVTTKPPKPLVDISASPDPPNGMSTVEISPERVTRSKAAKPAVDPSPKHVPTKFKPTKSPRTRASRPKAQPESKPVEEDARPAKRRRSNDQIAIPAQRPEVIEASNVVPLQEPDNPFEVGLKIAGAEAAAAMIPRPWDDLDAEDENDPLMVAEYVTEIFEYMKELEIRNMPSSVYMNSQQELDWNMRGILMDWLIQVHARFKLLPETLFLATNIIDRFLSLRIVSLIKLQLVGITALFIASKYEEIMAPSVTHFLQVSDSEYTEKEILQAEKYVLRTLNWELSYPNPMSWLRRASKADSYDVQTRTLAKFLIEISVVEHRLLKYTPSMLAAAALWLSRLMMEKDEWDANLQHYSGYTERRLIPCANVMLNYIIQPKPTHDSIWKKYSGKKYHKCAVYARKWAEQRWPPDSSDEAEEEAAEVEVDLVTALPVLREQISSKAAAGVGAAH